MDNKKALMVAKFDLLAPLRHCFLEDLLLVLIKKHLGASVFLHEWGEHHRCGQWKESECVKYFLFHSISLWTYKNVKQNACVNTDRHMTLRRREWRFWKECCHHCPRICCYFSISLCNLCLKSSLRSIYSSRSHSCVFTAHRKKKETRWLKQPCCCGFYLPWNN